MEAAWDAGVRTFDTAPHYGFGLSERRLGAALRHRPRATYTLATKVGRLLEPNPRGGAGDDLAHGFADRALRLLAVCERHDVPLRAAALRFPFGRSAVASVLTGARSPQEVRDTVEQLRRPIPTALWDELRAEGLLAPDTPVPAAAPTGEAMPSEEPSGRLPAHQGEWA